MQHLGKAPLRADGGVVGQVVGREEALLGDLAVGRRHARLAPFAHDEQGNVIGREGIEVGIHTEQLRRAGQLYPRFLLQLASQRLGDGLMLLDAAAGHVPAGPIAMPHQQHPLLRVEHHALRAHGQAACEAPVMLQRFDQERICDHGVTGTGAGCCGLQRHRGRSLAMEALRLGADALR